MDILIQFFGTRVISTFLVLLGNAGVGQGGAAFVPSGTTLYIEDDVLYMSVVLEDWAVEGLLDLIKSGNRVTLRLEASFELAGQTGFRSAEHTVVYDLLKEEYLLNRTESGAAGVTSRSAMTDLMSRFEDVRLADVPKEGGSFTMTVTAKLLPLKLESTGKTFDPMVYWNYRLPRLKMTTQLKQR